MRYVLVAGCTQELEKLPSEVQKKFFKQVNFLLKNIRHPSLHAKKYSESLGVWQARVDKNFRFYFKINDDLYVILSIKSHSD
jgi:mRNA interferase RelE/StbE